MVLSKILKFSFFLQKETLFSPEQFAFILLEDFDTQYKQQFIPLVAQQIRQQCATYGEAAEEDIIHHPKTGNEGEDEVNTENLGDDDAFGDLRIVVKVKIIFIFFLHIYSLA